MSPRRNDPKADTWDAERVSRWLAQAESLDRQLAPVSTALFAAADLRLGERVLDVGCGHGPTTRHAAAEVGEKGAVHGLDVSAAMLEEAQGYATVEGAAPIEWIQADVTAWDPPADLCDVVISRFGVMFFDDPVTAFTNLYRGASPGGRLAIATWAHRDRSPLFELPLSVVVPAMEAAGLAPEAPPVDDAAFSLGTPEVIASVLGSAGWREVTTGEHHLELLVGGGLSPADAGRASLELGPSRVLTAGVDEPQRERLAASIAEAYEDHVNADGHVELAGTVLITTASTERRPPDDLRS